MAGLTEVNAAKRSSRGVYVVVSANGSTYWLDLSGSVAAGVRVISTNAETTPVVREGTVGGCYCGADALIKVGAEMHLALQGSGERRHIGRVRVVSIRPAMPAEMEEHICKVCSTYKPTADEPCRRGHK